MADVSALEEAKLLERFTSEGELWWVLVGIDPSGGNASKPKMVIHAEGDTSIDSLKDHLLEDQLQYGCIKVLGVDTKGAVVSTRMKLVFFQWVGPRVPKLKASKAIPTKAALQSFFQGHHLALEIYEKAALTAADIEARLRAAGGAHQPSDMKFGSGSTVKVLAMPKEGETVETPKEAPAPAPVPAPAPAPTPVKAAPTNIFAAAASQGSGAAALPVKAAPAKEVKPDPATVGKAKEEAAAAVAAIGKAAAALKDLLKGGHAVSAEALEAFVAGPLGAAAVRGAAITSILAEL